VPASPRGRHIWGKVEVISRVWVDPLREAALNIARREKDMESADAEGERGDQESECCERGNQVGIPHRLQREKNP